MASEMPEGERDGTGINFKGQGRKKRVKGNVRALGVYNVNRYPSS
jgi:hypothetical protein